MNIKTGVCWRPRDDISCVQFENRSEQRQHRPQKRYYQRLKHMVSDKVQSRARGPAVALADLYQADKCSFAAT